MLRIVVLLSGSGSNLQAIIDAIKAKQLDACIALVISNKKNAFGLQRADKAGIPTALLNHRSFSSREEYDQSLMTLIDAETPDLIVLAGFMRILSTGFVTHYAQQLINIHPSLLPAYKGMNTHQRVIDNKERHHGVSVHFVTPELDAGPVIIQSKIDVSPNDSPDSLKQRTHQQEHIIYPRAIQWFAQGRLSIVEGEVLLDKQKQAAQLTDEEAH